MQYTNEQMIVGYAITFILSYTLLKIMVRGNKCLSALHVTESKEWLGQVLLNGKK